MTDGRGAAAAESLFVEGKIDEAEDAARAAGCYLCLHCGSVSPKPEWGPGRITCPRCTKRAPAVSEREAFFAERNTR